MPTITKETWEVRFEIDKECKNSRRYKPVSISFPIHSIYVDRSIANGINAFVMSLKETPKEMKK